MVVDITVGSGCSTHRASILENSLNHKEVHVSTRGGGGCYTIPQRVVYISHYLLLPRKALEGEKVISPRNPQAAAGLIPMRDKDQRCGAGGVGMPSYDHRRTSEKQDNRLCARKDV